MPATLKEELYMQIHIHTDIYIYIYAANEVLLIDIAESGWAIAALRVFSVEPASSLC